MFTLIEMHLHLYIFFVIRNADFKEVQFICNQHECMVIINHPSDIIYLLIVYYQQYFFMHAESQRCMVNTDIRL
jgi:hypothetical protein